MTSIVQITTTVDSEQAAQAIAASLVEKRLAACVQISGPICSVYRWRGEIETSQEWICAIKSTTSQIDNIQAAIRELHTYDLPEIIVTQVTGGHEPYLEWVRQSTQQRSG
jgi:periplasmic divalent cation tolerance protein